MRPLQMTRSKGRPPWRDEAATWLLVAVAAYVGALAAHMTWKIVTGHW